MAFTPQDEPLRPVLIKAPDARRLLVSGGDRYFTVKLNRQMHPWEVEILARLFDSDQFKGRISEADRMYLDYDAYSHPDNLVHAIEQILEHVKVGGETQIDRANKYADHMRSIAVDASDRLGLD